MLHLLDDSRQSLLRFVAICRTIFNASYGPIGVEIRSRRCPLHYYANKRLASGIRFFDGISNRKLQVFARGQIPVRIVCRCGQISTCGGHNIPFYKHCEDLGSIMKPLKTCAFVGTL
jgi:hypothetical protein